MSTTFDYDLVVIGAGSGGVRAARTAAGYGAKVAIVERQYLGGTCVNVGCVPKKLFVYASHYHEDFADARGFGWQVNDAQFDWTTLRENKNREIERLNGIYKNLLENAGVTLYEGEASLADAHTVRIVSDNGATQILSADKILIATGGKPFVPDFPGSEHVITSNEAFYLDSLPQKMVIVGGGYIAVEFAGIFTGLGVEVTQFYRRDLFLRGFEKDLREKLAVEMPKHGIDLRFNTDIASIEQSDAGYCVTTKTGEKLNTDLVMYATGRVPLVDELGLANTAVTINERGYIAVNDVFQTTEPSVFALGDVTGGTELTPVATAEAMVFSSYYYGDQSQTIDYDNIPSAVFSQPNLATVGLSEERARERFGDADVAVFKSSFRHLKHTLSGRDEQTFMKLVVQRSSDKVVGAHMLGSEAGEIIQGIAVAIRAGATKAVFDTTIGIHPTAAEEFVTLREEA